jgi:hypothetical protein
MLATIEFDDETRFYRAEIDNKAFDRMLPAEFDPELIAAHVRPQFAFSVRLLAAQFASELARREPVGHKQVISQN